ncbi:2'-5' RNA ligase family protein [Sporosalibacterium faouarense]|uniref:2'-5' RNA ligase family protein n=1 Tax=Sporosalibacterium faouarense TaxID=516123 RepID=UPI00192B1295|nr:2'-5' RNA ligase family protein [Sporosalibacterium faouarense]
MIKRSILIFPEFENIDKIESIRKKYDPVVENIGPHITLIFPFESDITTKNLKKHVIKSLEGSSPFSIELKNITGVEKNFLFLNVIRGKEEIINLHRKLYKGILKRYYPDFLTKVEFMPHLTVGKIDDEEKFSKALAETKKFDYTFETVVRKISVEIIAENNDSIIEFEVLLK